MSSGWPSVDGEQLFRGAAICRMAPRRAMGHLPRAVDGGCGRLAVPVTSIFHYAGSRPLRIDCGNLPHHDRGRRAPSPRRSAVDAGRLAVADAALLTGLLEITGGPYNPFIVMYAIYVWLAVATLSPRWGLFVTCISLLGFSWLVIDHLHAGKRRAPSVERLSDAPVHHVVRGSHDGRARGPLRRSCIGSPRCTPA